MGVFIGEELDSGNGLRLCNFGCVVGLFVGVDVCGYLLVAQVDRYF